ncbi:MAG TPA: hypothetical protein VGO04_24405 [Ensifer sp.]|jgi:hypothetical protein|uniref:hypothetical protein n=1 Tax=Ensifer sp. TaxID=1872086 RepID=UPI002E152BDC|nr:hypothetical protein [Ensifer sp.]
MKRVFSAAHYARRDRLRKTIQEKNKTARKFNAERNNQEANNDNFGIADTLSKTIVLVHDFALERESGDVRHGVARGLPES